MSSIQKTIRINSTSAYFIEDEMKKTKASFTDIVNAILEQHFKNVAAMNEQQATMDLIGSIAEEIDTVKQALITLIDSTDTTKAGVEMIMKNIRK